MFMDNQLLESVVEEALDAFWASVVERFPMAKTGDLSPETTFTLLFAAESAVKEWVSNNVE